MVALSWESLAGIVLFVIGIPVTYFLGRRNRQKPDLKYATHYEELLAPEDALMSSGLTLSFSGRSVDRICRSYVAIWNKRGDTVHGSEIVAADPICITLDEDDSVLSVRAVAFSREVIGLAVSPDANADNRVFVSFDFLDPGDGGVIEILHHLPVPPKVSGTVRGTILRYVGQVDLTQSARQAVRSSLWKRYLDRRPPFQKVVDLATVVAVVAGVAVGVVAVALSSRKPLLIQVKEYDLDSLVGQRDFARQVERFQPDGTFLSLGWILVGVTVLMLIVGLLSILTSVARRVPASVVAVERQLAIEPAETDDVPREPSGGSGSESLGFDVGSRVRHRRFGAGVIIGTTSAGDSRILEVIFDDHGRKRLLESRASLRRLT